MCVKVTRKVITVKQKFCIKKAHTFTIIASLREQLKITYQQGSMYLLVSSAANMITDSSKKKT